MPTDTAPSLLVKAISVNPAYLSVRFVLTLYPDTLALVLASEKEPNAIPLYAEVLELGPIATPFSAEEPALIPTAIADEALPLVFLPIAITLSIDLVALLPTTLAPVPSIIDSLV